MNIGFGDGAAKLENGRWLEIAEAKNQTAGQLEGIELAKAAPGAGREDERTVDDLGILKVGLERTYGEVMVKDRQHVIDAATAGDTPAPLERLRGGAVGARAAAEQVHKRHPSAERPAKDGAGLRGVDELVTLAGEAAGEVGAMFAVAGEVADLELQADVAGEIAGEADGSVRV